MPKRLSPTETAWLYVVGEKDGPFKLGFSTRPRARCAELALQTKRQLELLWWVETPLKTARSTELHAHKSLAAHERDGEWFFAPLDVMIDAAENAVREYPQIEHPLRPKPTRPNVAFGADPDVLEDIDNWRRGAAKGVVSRSAAIAALVRAGLAVEAEQVARGRARVETAARRKPD